MDISAKNQIWQKPLKVKGTTTQSTTFITKYNDQLVEEFKEEEFKEKSDTSHISVARTGQRVTFGENEKYDSILKQKSFINEVKKKIVFDYNP